MQALFCLLEALAMKRALGLLLVLLFLGGCGNAGKETPVDSGPGPDETDVPVRWGDTAPGGKDTETPLDQVAPQDTAPGPRLPPGYTEPCLTDGDCAEYGLECFSEGPTDMYAICSESCTLNGDCPDMMVCKKKGDDKICLVAGYCDECEDDSQCGDTSFRCIEDNSGMKFCSPKCIKDDKDSCDAGNLCKQVGVGLEEFFCFPMFGACKGDGSHCTPCQSDGDCSKGHECHENPYTHEKYCGRVCQTMQDCPKGFGCHELSGEQYPLCTMEIDDEPVETCYKGNKEFCEPCMKDYECTSDICYNYPVENKYFCAFPCDKSEWPVEGCPPGLYCAPNHGESGGDVCVPPTSWGCQGFLNCMQVECPKGEKCIDGFCEPK